MAKAGALTSSWRTGARSPHKHREDGYKMAERVCCLYRVSATKQTDHDRTQSGGYTGTAESAPGVRRENGLGNRAGRTGSGRFRIQGQRGQPG